MKIYRRAAFLDLPAGILYAKGKPWVFDGLNRKDETIIHNGKAIDFIYTALIDIEMGADTGEWAARQQEMLETGASYPMNEATMRDGCFDEEDLFLVYERADLAKLFSIISQASIVSP